jgi:histidyl-tRNA synthetase
MMMADTMEALGIPRGQYVIRVNNRKVLDGVMEAIGVTDDGQKLAVLRAIDKLDKFGPHYRVVSIPRGAAMANKSPNFWKAPTDKSALLQDGFSELGNIAETVIASGYESDRI